MLKPECLMLNNSLEVEVFEGEMDLHDAGGLDSGPEDVLLCGLVVLGPQPVQIVQKAEQSRVKIKFFTFLRSSGCPARWTGTVLRSSSRSRSSRKLNKLGLKLRVNFDLF
jgi:hypothetical protein